METAAKKKWAAPAFLQKLKRVNGLGALFPLAVICIFLCLFTGSFAQSNNIMQVLRQAASTFRRARFWRFAACWPA